MVKSRLVSILVVTLISGVTLLAQSGPPDVQDPAKDQISQTQQDSGTNSQPSTNGGTSGPVSSTTAAAGQQPKRILGILPNFRAVSADTQLPPLSVGGKFLLATQSSFDYSAFITAGIAAGWGQWRDSNPRFGQGAAGFGRRYWHWMAVSATGNYFTEAILPSAFGEDPRYYTLGHGNVLHRTGYALSRLVVTKRDSGRWAPNFSEIPGNGMGAAVSILYYPGERTWTKTYQLWISQVVSDGIANVLKEFWPDIARALPGGGKRSNP